MNEVEVNNFYLWVHFLPRIVRPTLHLTGGDLLEVLAAGEALGAALGGAGVVGPATLWTGGAVHNLRMEICLLRLKHHLMLFSSSYLEDCIPF